MAKIQMKTPLVEMDGDEITTFSGDDKEELILPCRPKGNNTT